MITFLILYLLISRGLTKQIGHRWDGSPAFPYYSAADFGVKEERFSFFSGRWKLDGSRYFMPGGAFKALIVVFHGIGAGRNAYMKTICRFAKKGFLVYAFDYTGCMRSEGTLSYGLGHVYNDVKAFYEFLDQDEKATGLRRFSWGHSWGGYAALLSSNPAYRVERIVSLAGVVDEGKQYSALAKTLRSPFFQFLIRLRSKSFEKVPTNSSFEDLSQTKARVLYIQGLKDAMVPYETSGALLKERFERSSHFSFLFLPDRDHYLDSSQKASDYIKGLMKSGLGKLNAEPSLSMDIAEATAVDEEIDKATFDFLSL